MSRKTLRRNEVIVGLDIGTDKVCAIVGEQSTRGIDIIGIGTAPSIGLRRGSIVNIDSTVNSIRKAVDEAQLMAGCEISQVFVGISGSHILGFNSKGIVAIKDNEVSSHDVDRVLDAASAVAIPRDRKILHILPQDYVIDENDGIRDPRGISGVRLEARVHIVTAAVAALENIQRCADRTDLFIADIVLGSLASSKAVLHDDEKELGVVLVDVGAGTMDVAIWFNGSLIHSGVIPLGGNHVSNDIAVGLRTPKAEAEKVKVKYGCALTSIVEADEMIEVPSVGGRSPQTRSRQLLCEIIEPRVEEMFGLIQQEIQKSGFEDMLASGVVLTGGTSEMPGMIELAEEIIGLPVRIGEPQGQGMGGLTDVVCNHKFSAGVGLVIHGNEVIEAEQTIPTRRRGSRSGSFKEKLKNLFGYLF